MARKLALREGAIREARIMCGLAKKDLADMCEVDEKTIYRMEKEHKATMVLLDVAVQKLKEFTEGTGIQLPFTTVMDVLKMPGSVLQFALSRVSELEWQFLETVAARSLIVQTVAYHDIDMDCVRNKTVTMVDSVDGQIAIMQLVVDGEVIEAEVQLFYFGGGEAMEMLGAVRYVEISKSEEIVFDGRNTRVEKTQSRLELTEVGGDLLELYRARDKFS